MTLLFVESFDHLSDGYGDLQKKWDTYSGTFPPSVGAAYKRTGTKGLYGGGSGTGYKIGKIFDSAQTTLIIGAAIYLPSPTDFRYPIWFQDGATTQVTIAIDPPTNRVLAYRGLGTALLGASANNAFLPNQWNYLEVKVTFSQTAGVVVVRVNEATVISATSLDTCATANEQCTAFMIGGGGAGLTCWIDDIYICNASGSNNNDFLGDCRVDCLFPTADGSTNNFTPSAGSNYQCVDDATLSEADYVASSTVNDIDLYTPGTLTSLVSPSVYGVQVNVAAKKSDTGGRSVAAVERDNSTNVVGTDLVLSTTTVFQSEVYEQDSTSSDWTKSSIEAAEFGVKVTA